MLPELCHFTQTLFPAVTPVEAYRTPSCLPKAVMNLKKQAQREQNPPNPALTDSLGERDFVLHFGDVNPL